MIISGLNEYLMPVNSPIENNLKNGPQSPYVFDYSYDRGIISETKMGSASVTSNAIAAAAVITSKFGTASVTSDILADLAVIAGKIAGSAVVESNIAGSAVTESKIYGSAITSLKIAADAVTSNAIAGSAVTTTKIADLAVTNAKVGTAAILTANIGTAVITNALMATASIDSAQIIAAAIGSAQIGTAAIQSVHIGSAAVGAAAIAALAVGSAAIGTAVIQTVHIGTIGFQKLYGGTATLGGTTNGNGLLVVNDASGSVRVQLDNTGLLINNGSITVKNSSGSTTLDSSGVVSTENFIKTDVSLAGPQTFTGTSYVDVTGGSLTFVTTRERVAAIYQSNAFFLVENAGVDACNGRVVVNLDGTVLNPALGINSGNNQLLTLSNTAFYSIGAGTHTLKVQGYLSTIFSGTPNMRIVDCWLQYVLFGT